MQNDLEIKKNKYFEYRNISPDFYKNYKLPAWLKINLKNKNLKILDFGCGYGQNLIALKNEGYTNIYGVDIESTAIDYLLNNGFDVKVVDDDPEKLDNPFPFKFDVILALHVIEHIQKDKIILTLKKLRERFLTRGGVMFVAVPNAQSNTGCYWAYEDWTHTTLFTSGSIYYVLKAAGFNKVEFLDVDCTLGNSKIKTIFRKIFLKLYILNRHFWNKITSSSYHQPSPQIFSYEIKVKAE